MRGYKGYHYTTQKLVDVIPERLENCARHILACGHSFLLYVDYSTCRNLDEWVHRCRVRRGKRNKCNECTRALFGRQFTYEN